MAYGEYSSCTFYTFNKPLCEEGTNINYVGVASDATMSKALQCNVADGRWVQFYLPKIVDIPVQKPDMEGIVTVNSCTEIISQRVVKTPTVTGYTNANSVFIDGATIPNAECTFLTGKKLIIEGIITQKVIYTALTAEQDLHSASFKIPFSTFIIVPKDTPLTQEFRVTAYLEDVYANMLSERSIFFNNTLFVKAVSLC